MSIPTPPFTGCVGRAAALVGGLEAVESKPWAVPLGKTTSKLIVWLLDVPSIQTAHSVVVLTNSTDTIAAAPELLLDALLPAFN